MRTKSESGIALLAMAVWITAFAAIAAIVVEIARLTLTATEVQTAADSGAIGGALALVRNIPGQMSSMGKSAAAANTADGRSVDPNGVQIELGHYSTDPSANPHFTTGCAGTDCNAVKATVTVDNVQYIIASIIGGSQSSVQKIAVAAAECQGSGNPLPLAVCNQALASPLGQDTLCVDGVLKSGLSMQSGSNACWTYLSSPTQGTSTVQGLFPNQCGGTAPAEDGYVTLGQNLNFVGNPGVSVSTWQALQCCLACQGLHKFTVPVIDCSGGGNPCQGDKPVIGFTTLDISQLSDGSNGNTQCNNKFSPWGNCGVTVDNGWSAGLQEIAANQICHANDSGTPGGSACTNFGNTVAPVMGQLP
jgi:hypothetical protein